MPNKKREAEKVGHSIPIDYLFAHREAKKVRVRQHSMQSFSIRLNPAALPVASRASPSPKQNRPEGHRCIAGARIFLVHFNLSNTDLTGTLMPIISFFSL